MDCGQTQAADVYIRAAAALPGRGQAGWEEQGRQRMFEKRVKLARNGPKACR